MTQTIVTIDQAQAELDRRATPKATRPRSTDPVTFRMTGAELALAVAQAKAPAVKAARPTGPGSRGGNPVKAACARKAGEVAAKGTAEWWVAYRKATAVAKAAGLL